jgi:hypothetical protein
VNREMQNVNCEVPELDADTLRPEPAFNDQTLSLALVCQKRHFRISHFAFRIFLYWRRPFEFSIL